MFKNIFDPGSVQILCLVRKIFYNTNNFNVLYLRFDLPSEVFIRNDFRFLTSVCKLFHMWLVGSSRHLEWCCGSSCFPYLSAKPIWFPISHLYTVSIYQVVLSRRMICEHRKEVESITEAFRKAEKTTTKSICHKSAITVIFILSLLFVILTMDTLSKINLMMDG